MGKEFLEEPSAFAVFKKGVKPSVSLLKEIEKAKQNNKKLLKNKLEIKTVKGKQDHKNKNPTINKESVKIKKKKSPSKNVLNKNVGTAFKSRNIDPKLTVKKKQTTVLPQNGNVSNGIVKKVKSKTIVKSKKKSHEHQENKLSENAAPANDSVQSGESVFKRLLKPTKLSTFFDQYWEKKPCLIKKSDPKVFSHLISFEMIDRMLRQHHIEFTKNIDITSYKNGVRETLNPEGRALPPDVWNFYNDGCSIRLLNPQTFLPAIYTMNATLQEYFHCMVGANIYLTPPNSQGFAPHYDDIEAFVLQVEGKKRWKVYAPRNSSEKLPRFSSENLNANEIGKPLLEIVLEPGNVLYFPRGFIHQACTEPGYHSLHITLSVYQKQSYADLFEQLVPMALQNAITNNVSLRQGLPLNIWRNVGTTYSNINSTERDVIFNRTKELLKKIIDEMPLDNAVDQLAKKYQHDALPPVLPYDEITRTVFGNNTTLNNKGEAITNFEINLNTNIRLLRANILRIVKEENAVRVYYYIDNSREYHEYDANFIEIEEDTVSGINELIKSYPNYIKVEDLPLQNDDEKLGVIQSLWERGLLITDNPIS